MNSNVLDMPNNVAEQVRILANNGQLAHAYIVETRDFESTSLSLNEIYKAFLCLTNNHDLELLACQSCKSCLLFDAGNHPDFKLLGGDATSIGIDEVRSISAWQNKTAQISSTQVMVIEHAQNMTENAANALLKTLEEPTNNSFLFLINSSSDKLLPTITSRCQVLKQTLKSNESLKANYPDLPDYLIGFANGNESRLKEWQDKGTHTDFQEVFDHFMGWLKNKSGSAALIKRISKEPVFTEFFTYLLERRVRQMLLAGYFENAQQAIKQITEFNFAQKHIKGQNKELALTAFIEKLELLVK